MRGHNLLEGAGKGKEAEELVVVFIFRFNLEFKHIGGCF